MKKEILDLTVSKAERLSPRHVVLRLSTDGAALPPMMPGQFVEVRIDATPSVLLRRPISIHFVDHTANELWLLVAMVGDGTRWIGSRREGDRLNCVLPLGNGFTMPRAEPTGHEVDNTETAAYQKPLLVGGGVGVAPLLYLGAELKARGIKPTFLLGGRTAGDVLQTEAFGKYGRVCVTTEDGSLGERGFVTNHSVLDAESFDHICTCGPTPMMKAVARYARERNVACEASLENLMACGLGACLCCVEKTTQGNVCVCKEGPVFDINQLLW